MGSFAVPGKGTALCGADRYLTDAVQQMGTEQLRNYVLCRMVLSALGIVAMDIVTYTTAWNTEPMDCIYATDRGYATDCRLFLHLLPAVVLDTMDLTNAFSHNMRHSRCCLSGKNGRI
jgi:hypothetical protein